MTAPETTAAAGESASWVRWLSPRWLLPLAVVVPMLAAGSALRLPQVVFPEGAALAAGLWTLNNPLWACSRTRLLVLPPACATCGVALAAVPLPRGLLEIAALLLGLTVLQAARSRLAPCLSAVMFPVVFGIRGWVFPVAVAVICAVLALGLPARPGGRARHPLPPRLPARLVAGYALAAGGWIAAGHLAAWAPAALFAPPVFVSGLEWTAGERPTLSAGTRRWALLTAAALAGGGAALLAGPLPSWAAGSLAVLAAVAAARLLADPHPPALAVSLIPFVLHRPNPLAFAAAVAVTAAVLLVAGTAVTAVVRRPGPGGRPGRRSRRRTGPWPAARPATRSGRRAWSGPAGR